MSVEPFAGTAYVLLLLKAATMTNTRAHVTYYYELQLLYH